MNKVIPVFSKTHLIMLIPRGIETVIYLTCAFMIIKKNDKKHPYKPGNALKITFSKAFVCWGLYVIMEMLFNIVAAISIPPVPGTYNTLYSFEYPSLSIANLLRDFQMVFAALTNYYTFRSIQIVTHGAEYGTKQSKNIFVVLFYVIMAVLCIPLDRVFVTIKTNLDTTIGIQWDIAMPILIIAFLMYLTTFTYSAISIVVLLLKNLNNLHKQWKLRLILFMFGYWCLLLGLYYFIFTGLLQISLPFNEVEFQIVGHSFWMIAPLMFYFAFRIDSNEESFRQKFVDVK